MYWENQPKLPSDNGSNRSRGANRDIGSGPLKVCMLSHHGSVGGHTNCTCLLGIGAFQSVVIRICGCFSKDRDTIYVESKLLDCPSATLFAL